MNKLSKKYKNYLLCFVILLIVGIGFAFCSSNQEKKATEKNKTLKNMSILW